MIAGVVGLRPPVGPRSIQADIIDSGVVPTIRLTEIFHQAASSRFIVKAHRFTNRVDGVVNMVNRMSEVGYQGNSAIKR
jgi:ATP-dependent exoDNAse (exonuclease V) alpha subunit